MKTSEHNRRLIITLVSSILGASWWSLVACSTNATIDYPDTITDADFQPGYSWTVMENHVMDHGTEGGTNWIETQFDADAAVHPCVLHRSATLWQMWYTGYDQVTSMTDDGSKTLTSVRSSIGYAVSTDGITWNKYAQNPVLGVSQYETAWDHDKVMSPWVLWDASASMYCMWYTGYNGSLSMIGYAESTDGTNWTRSSSNPVLRGWSASEWFDDDGARFPCVLDNNDGTWIMYYEGETGGISRIGTATSTNFVDWIKIDGPGPDSCLLDHGGKGDIASDQIGFPRVIDDPVHPDRRRIFYTGYNGRYIRLGQAIEAIDEPWDDGAGNDVWVVRQRDESNRAAELIELGKKDSWYDLAAAMPTVISENGTMTMWFSAWGTYGRIGYATSVSPEIQ